MWRFSSGLVVAGIFAVSGCTRTAAPAAKPSALPGKSTSPIAVRPGESLESTIQDLFRQQRFDEAIAFLEQRLATNADDQEARLLLGRVHAGFGQQEKALTVWKAGLHDNDEDAPLLANIGRLLMQQGEDGPNISHDQGRVIARPSTMSKEQEKQWKRAKYVAAAEALEKVARIDGREESFAHWAEALWKADPNANLEKIVRLADDHPNQPALALTAAQALHSSDQHEQALRRVNQFLKNSPQDVEALRLAAASYEKLGKVDEAEDAKSQAVYYEWMPAFLSLEYSDERADRAKQLQDDDSREKAVQQLIEEKSPESSRLLASVCLHHVAHGDVENRCFAALEEREEGDLIAELMKNARSTCTIRSAGFILARLKHSQAFELLAHYLPANENPFFPSETELALAELGDPRAVPLLIEVLSPNQHRGADSDDDFIEQSAREQKRLRAAVALGTFSLPESKQALQAGVEDEEIAGVCHAALYRLTSEPKHLQAAKHALKKDDLSSNFIIHCLRQVKTEDAAQIVAAWEKQKRDERAKEEEERAKEK